MGRFNWFGLHDDLRGVEWPQLSLNDNTLLGLFQQSTHRFNAEGGMHHYWIVINTL
jgi:hypothetical protein